MQLYIDEKKENALKLNARARSVEMELFHREDASLPFMEGWQPVGKFVLTKHDCLQMARTLGWVCGELA